MQEQHDTLTAILHDTNFWFGVSFVIFVIATWVGGRKPIAGFFDSYAAKIRAELDEAAKLRAEAERLLADTKTRQANAMQEAENIRNQASAQVQMIREQAEKELEATMKRREQQAMDRIHLLEEQAVQEIRASTVDMALKAAERILRERMTANDDAALIGRHIGQMAQGLKKVA